MSAMDWRLTDAQADPPGMTEHLHSERLVRLPETFACFRPSDQAPAAGVLPAGQAGEVTFGCFNARAKVSDGVLALWARLLGEVPGSRLLLKNTGFGQPSVQGSVRAVLGRAGIAEERLTFMGHTPSVAGHLAGYSGVDIGLDTFPYCGTTTTCEALWMGVPVVTLEGRTHASRVGVSLLRNVGLPELVAQSGEEYVSIAAGIAADRARLAELRATLRERMKASPLMDAPRFAREIEAAYREMWREWCLGVKSEPAA
jgi:predicted O-linked N-acetylglucosamine transferase (SPINDLY family)